MPSTNMVAPSQGSIQNKKSSRLSTAVPHALLAKQVGGGVDPLDTITVPSISTRGSGYFGVRINNRIEKEPLKQQALDTVDAERDAGRGNQKRQVDGLDGHSAALRFSIDAAASLTGPSGINFLGGGKYDQWHHEPKSARSDDSNGNGNIIRRITTLWSKQVETDGGGGGSGGAAQSGRWSSNMGDRSLCTCGVGSPSAFSSKETDDMHARSCPEYEKTHRQASVVQMGMWQTDEDAEKANTQRPFYMLRLYIKEVYAEMVKLDITTPAPLNNDADNAPLGGGLTLNDDSTITSARSLKLPPSPGVPPKFRRQSNVTVNQATGQVFAHVVFELILCLWESNPAHKVPLELRTKNTEYIVRGILACKCPVNKSKLTEQEIDGFCAKNEFCHYVCYKNAQHRTKGREHKKRRAEKHREHLHQKWSRWSRKAPSQRHILALWSACQTLFKSSKSNALFRFFFSPQYANIASKDNPLVGLATKLLHMSAFCGYKEIVEEIITLYEKFKFANQLSGGGDAAAAPTPPPPPPNVDQSSQVTEAEASSTIDQCKGRSGSGRTPSLGSLSESSAPPSLKTATSDMTVSPSVKVFPSDTRDRSSSSSSSRRHSSIFETVSPAATPGSGRVDDQHGTIHASDSIFSRGANRSTHVKKPSRKNRHRLYWNAEWTDATNPVHLHDHKGRTALHIAVAGGHLNVIKLLLAYGADLLARTLADETVIHVAARHDHEKVMFYLFEIFCTQQDVHSYLQDQHAPSRVDVGLVRGYGSRDRPQLKVAIDDEACKVPDGLLPFADANVYPPIKLFNGRKVTVTVSDAVGEFVVIAASGEVEVRVAAGKSYEWIPTKGLYSYQWTPKAGSGMKRSRGNGGNLYVFDPWEPLSDLMIDLCELETLDRHINQQQIVNKLKSTMRGDEGALLHTDRHVSSNMGCPCWATKLQITSDKEHDKLYIPNVTLDRDKRVREKYRECHGIELDAGNSGLRPQRMYDEDSLLVMEDSGNLIKVLSGLKHSRNGNGWRKRHSSHYDAFCIIRDMRDRLGRTALHTAAIMDRDSATKALLALGSDPATRDIFHDLCLQEMVVNMPSIANQALNMFHEIDKLSRMEYFYIKQLECIEAEVDGSSEGDTKLKGLSRAEARKSQALLQKLKKEKAEMEQGTGKGKGKGADARSGASSIASLSDNYGEQRSRNFAYIKPTMPRLQMPDETMPRSLLEEIVSTGKESVVTNPTIKRIMHKKWRTFASRRHTFDMIVYFLYLSIWSAGPMLEAYNADQHGTNGSTCLRNDPAGNTTVASNLFDEISSLWGGKNGANKTTTSSHTLLHTRRAELVLDWLGILFVGWYITIEVWEFWSKKRRSTLLAARARNIIEHGEAQYLLLSPADYHNRIAAVKEAGSSLLGASFINHVISDGWNILDWTSYILFFLSFVLKQIYQFNCKSMEDGELDWGTRMWSGYQRMWSIGLVLAWYKIMKYLRAYSRFGPFVTMLDHIAKDTGKFLVLYIVMLVPVTITFMMFSEKDADFRKFQVALFGVYSLTMGDSSFGDIATGHGHDDLKMQGTYRNTSQGEMSMWLYTVYVYWTVVSAIVMVNLLIAMMGQSFQDVYDESKRYAQMERAKVIVAIEEAIAFPMLGYLLPKAFHLDNISSPRYSSYVRDAEIGIENEPYNDNDDDDVTIYSTRMDILNAVKENTFRLDAMEGMFVQLQAMKEGPAKPHGFVKRSGKRSGKRGGGDAEAGAGAGAGEERQGLRRR